MKIKNIMKTNIAYSSVFSTLDDLKSLIIFLIFVSPFFADDFSENQSPNISRIEVWHQGQQCSRWHVPC
jgi:hypothetical protein